MCSQGLATKREELHLVHLEQIMSGLLLHVADPAKISDAESACQVSALLLLLHVMADPAKSTRSGCGESACQFSVARSGSSIEISESSSSELVTTEGILMSSLMFGM